jgi:hypothetical protein
LSSFVDMAVAAGHTISIALQVNVDTSLHSGRQLLASTDVRFGTLAR